MFTLFASAFASLGMLLGGLFGGHFGFPPVASSTPMHGMHMSSTTPWGGHIGSTTPWGNGSSTPGHMGMMPGIFGTVLSVNGDTIMVAGRAGFKTATTTYTVDATNAKIIKGGASGNVTSQNTISVSDIQVNDSVIVNGTINGDNVTAKIIIDGVMRMMPQMMMMNGRPMTMPNVPPQPGSPNGQPRGT